MKHTLLFIALAASLTACGGGGGDQTTAAGAANQQSATSVPMPGDMTRYAGTWSTACMPQGAQSARMTLQLSATATSATGRAIADGYAVPNCAGASAQVTQSFTATYAGQVGTAEKLNVTQGNDKGTMTATLSQDGNTLTIDDGDVVLTLTK